MTPSFEKILIKTIIGTIVAFSIDPLLSNKIRELILKNVRLLYKQHLSIVSQMEHSIVTKLFIDKLNQIDILTRFFTIKNSFYFFDANVFDDQLFDKTSNCDKIVGGDNWDYQFYDGERIFCKDITLDHFDDVVVQSRLLKNINKIFQLDIRYTDVEKAIILLTILFKLKNFMRPNLVRSYLDDLYNNIVGAKENVHFMSIFLSIYPCDLEINQHASVQIALIRNFIDFMEYIPHQSMWLCLKNITTRIGGYNKRTVGFIYNVARKVCINFKKDESELVFGSMPDEMFIRNYSLYLVFLIRYKLKVKLSIDEFLRLMLSTNGDELSYLLRYNKQISQCVDQHFLSIIIETDFTLCKEIPRLGYSLFQSFVQEVTMYHPARPFIWRLKNRDNRELPIIYYLLRDSKLYFSQLSLDNLIRFVVSRYSSTRWRKSSSSSDSSRCSNFIYDPNHTIYGDIFMEICYRYCVDNKLYKTPHFNLHPTFKNRIPIPKEELLELYGNIYWRANQDNTSIPDGGLNNYSAEDSNLDDAPISDGDLNNYSAEDSNLDGGGIYYNILNIMKKIDNKTNIELIYEEYLNTKAFRVCDISSLSNLKKFVNNYRPTDF